MQEKFRLIGNGYNLRRNITFESRPFRTQKYGKNQAPDILSSVPRDIKVYATLDIFKSKTKNWSISGCPCKLCQRYIPNLGYLKDLAFRN